MSGFVKLDEGLLDSSLWAFRDDRSVFLTALLMARPCVVSTPMPQLHVRSLEPTGWVVPPGKYGLIAAAGVGIVRRDGIAEEEGYRALERLCAPDPESRSHDYEGRRLARVDGGYIVLNYMRFREKDYTSADRSRRYRDRQRDGDVTQRDGGVADRDAYASASTSASGSVESTETTEELDRERGDRRFPVSEGDYCTRLAIGANKGLGHEIPRIMASSGSTQQVAEILMGADIPIEFAERIIYERAISLAPGVGRDIRALSYFTRAVVEAWEREGMKEQVARSPLAPGQKRQPAKAADVLAAAGALIADVRLCPVCERMLAEADVAAHCERKHPGETFPPFAEWRKA